MHVWAQGRRPCGRPGVWPGCPERQRTTALGVIWGKPTRCASGRCRPRFPLGSGERASGGWGERGLAWVLRIAQGSVRIGRRGRPWGGSPGHRCPAARCSGRWRSGKGGGTGRGGQGAGGSDALSEGSANFTITRSTRAKSFRGRLTATGHPASLVPKLPPGPGGPLPLPGPPRRRQDPASPGGCARPHRPSSRRRQTWGQGGRHRWRGRCP
jgi:hypothetical protein